MGCGRGKINFESNNLDGLSISIYLIELMMTRLQYVSGISQRGIVCYQKNDFGLSDLEQIDLEIAILVHMPQKTAAGVINSVSFRVY